MDVGDKRLLKDEESVIWICERCGEKSRPDEDWCHFCKKRKEEERKTLEALYIDLVAN